MNRRTFLKSIAPAAALTAGAQTRKPNIVFIILDDLGSGDLGCYGQKHILTPNIDKFATEGVKFTQCYAGGAVCAPSRAVLMTGLHGGHAPVRANAGTIPILDADVTTAEVLKKAGYTTGGFGKWGLGDAGSTGTPTKQGFDEFFGYLHQTHAHHYYTDFLRDGDKKVPLKNVNGAHEQYSADLIAERSLEFIRRNKEKPFFLYACCTLPHAKFEVPSLKPYEDKQWPEGHKTYAAMITRADAYVGSILTLLKDLNLESNTAVFITSDNGAHMGEQKGFEFFKSNGSLRGEKGTLYEGGIRVPMLVRWPGKATAGRVSDLPWNFADVLPTLAEIGGASAPAQLDGMSVVSEIAGKGSPKRPEYLYWEHQTYDFNTKQLREGSLMQAVRIGDWKGVRNKPGSPIELYNLRDDPSERTDRAGEKPDLVRSIEAKMKAARTSPRRHDTGTRTWLT